MRNDVSRLKYLAFVLVLGACFFDPKAVGPGSQTGSQNSDSGAAGNDGTAGPTNNAGDKAGAGEGGSGSGAVSGGTSSGTAGMVAAGVGGMSANGGMDTPPPPLLANGESCSDDALCKSGHCDTICCDKGADCCKTVADCATQPGGLGMSCDDRASCRGSAGKITCTPEFKCVTMNGVRNDTACSNRVEANDCGLYPSIFCLGGEMQSGAPPCATSCKNDSECDPEAHCTTEGKCVADLANGEPCKRGEDCAQGLCKDIKNGMGICCGALGYCCKVANDCPDMYRQAPRCNTQTCTGTELVAQCNGNICNSTTVGNDAACTGMKGPDCGAYADITCMPGRDNRCKNSCANAGDCDSNAFCDAGRCLPKRASGADCSAGPQCMSGNCGNGVCCSPNGTCCKTADQCTEVDLKCDQVNQCQGSRRTATCTNFMCSYSPNRIDDDSACKTGGNNCGEYRDVSCNGMPAQDPCKTSCTSAADCDSGAQCVTEGTAKKCLMIVTTAGTSGGSSGGASGNPGND